MVKSLAARDRAEQAIVSHLITMEPEPQTKVLPPGHAEASNVAPTESMTAYRSLGRYEIVQRLGHGGMATVYLARATGNAGFEKLVAVKVIHAHLAAEPEFVEMFLEEARIAAKIQSPHVAGILDLCHEDGLHFMVMEYIDGETLSGLIRQLRPNNERLPLPLVLQILIDACQGLTAVHDLRDADGNLFGLVHRDMSPQNLMIGFDGWTKIVDFGLVKATSQHHTHTGHLRGKLAYMSPEQARGKPLTASADLFALGVVFWELLTGTRLFAGDSDAETLERVVRCELPPLHTLRDDLTPDIEPILRRALARDPAERYPSADAMLADLRRSLRDHVGPEDPRKLLAATMRQHFEEQHNYRNAALRGASRSSGRPRMRLVPRPPSQPVLERGARGTSLATVPGAADDELRPHDDHEPSSAGLPRPVTGGNPTLGLEDSASRTLSHGPGRHWLWWLALPALGAALTAAILLGMLGWPDRGSDRSNIIADVFTPETPVPSVSPAPHREPSPPHRILWNLESEPPGAQVSLTYAPPAIADELAGQLAGQLTPFSVEIPYDERSRIEILVSRAGYKDNRRSLLPISSENINISLQPDLTPEPVLKRKIPRFGPARLAPQKPSPLTTSTAGDELKHEPNFGSAAGPSRGTR